jgi:peptidyl-prolyl cis-trans isomerase SurA
VRRLLALLCALSLAGPALARIVDRVVAVVNEDIITWSELEDLQGPVLRQVESIDDPVLREQQRDRQLRAGLDELVGRRLIAQEAARRRITVTGEDVNDHLQRVQASQGWDDERLRLYLASQGMNLAEFRRQVRDQLLQQKVVRTVVGQRVRVSDGDLREYYKEQLTQAESDYEVDGAHIALPVPAGATAAEDAAVRQLAQELLTRARSGEDFAALSRDYSKAPTAQDGGSLGRFRRGVIDPSLEAAIFELAEGAVGGPVRTRYGYHVVKAVKKRKLPPPPFEEAAENLRRELAERRMQEELARWVDELKKKAFVEIRL